MRLAEGESKNEESICGINRNHGRLAFDGRRLDRLLCTGAGGKRYGLRRRLDLYHACPTPLSDRFGGSQPDGRSLGDRWALCRGQTQCDNHN